MTEFINVLAAPGTSTPSDSTNRTDGDPAGGHRPIMFGIASTTIDDFRRSAAPGHLIATLRSSSAPFIMFAHADPGVDGALGMILVVTPAGQRVQHRRTCRGDVALSVSMTAVGKLLAIFLMLNFALWAVAPDWSTWRSIDLNATDMLSGLLSSGCCSRSASPSGTSSSRGQGLEDRWSDRLLRSAA